MKNKRKTRNQNKQDGPIVIELNLSLTIGVIGAIIAIIVAITTVKVITTMIQANENKNVANESDINQHAIYVTSTTKDENGNIVEDKDSDGNVIKVPVPKGYTASQIDGETSANKGFVIYEGDVDWSKILVNTNTQNTKANDTESTNINTESIQSNKTQPTNSAKTQNTGTKSTVTESTNTVNTETKSTNDMPNDGEQTEENTIVENVQNTQSTTNTQTSSTEATNNKTISTEKTRKTQKTENEENKNENQNNITTSTKQEENQDNQATKNTVEDSSTSNQVTSSTTNSTTESTNIKQNENNENNIQESPKETIVENGIDGTNAVDVEDETADDTGATDSGETTLTLEEQQAKNIFDLQKERNQYVWVPVSDISQIYGVDSNKKIWGKLYNFSSSGRSNRNWTETNGIISITNATSYREPDVVWRNYYVYDTDGYVYMHNGGLGQTRYEMLAQELEQNYLEIMEEIKKYGGFYIGRYELGYENNQAVVKKMNTNNTNEWYESYKSCLTLKGSNDNIKTMMITGNLWDETLEWLVKSEATNSAGTVLTYLLVGGNSETFGNYYNATFNYIAKDAKKPIETETKDANKKVYIPTGSSEYTKTNNIYDMAGNVNEWTTEIYPPYYRVGRGGYCNDTNASMAHRCFFHPGYSNPANYNDNGHVRLSSNTLYKIVYFETLYSDTAPRRVTN